MKNRELKNRRRRAKIHALRYAAVLICAILSAALSVAVCFAGVITESSMTGAADTIYVAGNPDAYPIEYYDSESDSYKGVIPDLLGIVSEKSGVSFTYISAGAKNEQKRISRNNQAELITAVLLDDKKDDITVTERYPILTAEVNGKEKCYCIGFTEIASSELKDSIKSILGGISEEEKTGLLLSYAQNNRAMPKSRFWTYIAVTFAATAVIALSVFLIIRQNRKKKNVQESMTDPLTGLGNGNYYLYVFDSLITRQSKNLYNVAYIAYNAEKAEAVFGKDACRDIQKYAAASLNGKAGQTEYLSRIQDGVFVFVFQAESKEKTDSRISELISGLNLYLGGFNNDWSALFSAGVCRLAEHPDCNAETALYSAKQGYMHAKKEEITHHIGSGSQLAENRKRDRLRLMLSDAIKNEEFRIYLQFIAISDSGKICGAEALSRWQNPEYGMLRPHEYIELLKESGKIVEHDYKMLERVCRLLEEWRIEPYSNLFLTCNFTRLSASKSDFAEKISEIASGYDFDRSRLVIEITEDSLTVDSGAAARNIRLLRKIGFKVAIDDMGGGFSSLSDLYDNETDIVKIEKDFIADCVSERRLNMLSDIISLVHNSGARVICEGIETEEQLERIRETGSDMVQGFYYSRVLPYSECEKFLCTKEICENNILCK